MEKTDRETATGQDTARPAFLTIAEVSRHLRVSQRTVYRWLQSGRLPGFHLGNTTRIAWTELDAFVRRHTTAEADHGPTDAD